MEPDLDRIVDFESGGGLFPQFGANWRDCFAAARQLKEGIVGSGIARPRIAFWMMDPMSFCAAFLALCRSDLDLFFYNDYWGTKEINAADKKCEPHWVVGRCKEGRFDCSRRESGEGARAPPPR